VVERGVKRSPLTALHQEFDVTQTYKTGHGDQGSKRQIILDLSREKWREKAVSGSGSLIEFVTATTCCAWKKAAMSTTARNVSPRMTVPSQPSASTRWLDEPLY
jgi:hypothetical protein